MTCISSIYMISWTLPVFYFLPKDFSDHLLAFPFLFRRIYQYQWWHHSHDTRSKACQLNTNTLGKRHSHDTQFKACQSNTNTLGYTHFDMDHHHQMFGVLPNSILQQSFSVVNILPTYFNHHIMTTFMIKLLQLIRTNYEYNINSQNLFGRSGRLASPTLTNSHTI